METAHFKLLLGDLAGTKDAMDKCGKIVEAMDAVDRGVNASFYRVSGDYYKVNSIQTPSRR
jgi:26S proteasome regulatory subunit N9